MSEEFANQLKIRVRLGVEPQHTLPFIKKYIKEDFSQYTVNGNQKSATTTKRYTVNSPTKRPVTKLHLNFLQYAPLHISDRTLLTKRKNCFNFSDLTNGLVNFINILSGFRLKSFNRLG